MSLHAVNSSGEIRESCLSNSDSPGWSPMRAKQNDKEEVGL
jgi:hypothetical protein